MCAQIANPSSSEGRGLNPPASSGIGIAEARTFRVKVRNVDVEDFVSYDDQMADGDEHAIFEHTGIHYARVTIIGEMVAALSVQVSNLAKTGNPVTFVLNWTNGLKETRTLLVERIRRRWNPERQDVPVVIVGIQTGTDPDTIEGATDG